MVVERQPVTGTTSPTNTDQQLHQISTKRVRAAPSLNIYRPPAARRLEALVNSELSCNTPVTPPVVAKTEKVRVAKQRRPDIQVYVPRAKRTSAVVDKDSGLQRAQPVRRSLDISSSNGAVSKSPSLHSRWGSGTLVSTGEVNVYSDPSIPRIRKLVRHSLSEQNVSVLVPTPGCSSSEPEPLEQSCVAVNGQKNGSSVSEAVCVQKMERLLSNETVVSPSGDECSVGVSDVAMELENCNPMKDSGVLTCVESDCDDVEVSAHEMKKEELENIKKCDSENRNEDSVSVTELFSVDILSADSTHKCKKDEEEEALKKREEQNRKNRRILRGSYMSDVLIISDPDPHEPPPPDPPEPVPVEESSKNSSLVKKKKVVHKSETPVTSVSSSTPTIKLNPDECTWDMMFDDDGECLDPKLVEELTSSVGSVTITKPQSNYDQYETKTEVFLPGAEDEFAHVVEIYNFPPEFKTQDLLSVFSPYKNGGFEIKWVDDTHALGVFSSSLVAADVLATDHPFVKTRPLRDATPESRTKARRSAEFLQPYRARPETCVALARRLVTASLGVRLNTSREEREAERKMLREAREKKRLVAQQKEDAWEGNIGKK